MYFPVLDSVECVIEPHPDSAVIAPKAPHPSRRGERCLRLRGRRLCGALFGGLVLYASGFTKLLPLPLLEGAR